MGGGFDGDHHRVQRFLIFLFKKRPVIGIHPLAAKALRRRFAPLLNRIGYRHHRYILHLLEGVHMPSHSAAAANQAKPDFLHFSSLLLSGGFSPPLLSDIIILSKFSFVNLNILINYKDIAVCLQRFEKSI